VTALLAFQVAECPAYGHGSAARSVLAARDYPHALECQISPIGPTAADSRNSALRPSKFSRGSSSNSDRLPILSPHSCPTSRAYSQGSGYGGAQSRRVGALCRGSSKVALHAYPTADCANLPVGTAPAHATALAP